MLKILQEMLLSAEIQLDKLANNKYGGLSTSFE